MTTSTVPESETPRFLHLPTRQIIDFMLFVWERELRMPPHAIERTVDPLRAEVRRREARGFDDPFDSPYPEVTW
jgi:hypothetical protein